LLRAGHDQGHLRHRLFRGAQHRRRPRAVEEPPARNHRLPAARPDDLRARRIDLRRRRRGAVAARRPGHHQERDRIRRARRPGGSEPAGLARAGLHRDGGAALGSGCARRDLRHHARHGTEGAVPSRARGRVLPDARPARCDVPRLAARRRHGAAGRRRHGRERLDHPASRRPARCAGRPAGRARDDRARRGLARRHAGGRVARRSGIREGLAARASLRGGDGGGSARPGGRRMARGGAPDDGPDSVRKGPGARVRRARVERRRTRDRYRALSSGRGPRPRGLAPARQRSHGDTRVMRIPFARILAAAVIASAAGFAVAADDEIRLGNTVPYSGPASFYGSIGKATSAYFEMINDQGGINGRKVRVISLDDGLQPPKTVEQTRKLVEQEEVHALVNQVGTATASAVRKYLNAKKVPQLFVLSGSQNFQDPENCPYSTSGLMNYQFEAQVYGKQIVAASPDAKIGVLYQNDDFGKDYVAGLKAGAGKAVV